MEPQQFLYWLQGFVELSEGKMPTPAQWKSICEHLNTVFHKVTPPVGEQKKTETKKAKEGAEGEEAIKKMIKEWQDQQLRHPYTPWPGDWPPIVTC